MADLLGSLLPASYMAPDVQTVLGGELADRATCIYGHGPQCYSGTSPWTACSPTGSEPFIVCEPSGI